MAMEVGDTLAFSDSDPLEDDMGVRCEDMSPDQLIAYIKSYQAAFGLNLTIAGMPERSVFKSMQRLYGKADTGRIVKWVFYCHRGRWDDQPITPLSFAKGRKWWVDKMHLEMQEAVSRENLPAPSYSLGITSLADL